MSGACQGLACSLRGLEGGHLSGVAWDVKKRARWLRSLWSEGLGMGMLVGEWHVRAGLPGCEVSTLEERKGDRCGESPFGTIVDDDFDLDTI
jgi:hypothetical protein